MQSTTQSQSIIMPLIVGFFLALFIAPILIVVTLNPEIMQEKVTELMPGLSALLVGFFGVIIAKCNFSMDTFREAMSPTPPEIETVRAPMLFEAKLLMGISVLILLMGVLITSVLVFQSFS